MTTESEHSPLSFVDNRFGSGTRVRPEFEQYANNGALAIRLVVDGNQGDSYDGDPWAHTTLNISAPQNTATLKRGNVALKNWSENQGLPELMVKAGIVTDENREIKNAPIFMLTEKAMELAGDLLDAPAPKKRGIRP